MYAEPAQRVERCERIALQQKNRFGDFNLQPIGRQPRRRQRLLNRGDEVAVLELSRRYVDGDANALRPARGFRARTPQNPITDRND